MFRFEKDMLPVIEEKIGRRYKSVKCIREFNSGNGISDLTFAVFNNKKPEISIQNYAEMYYLITFFNKLGEKICVDDLMSIQNLNRQTLISLVQKLAQNSFIIEKDGYCIVKKLYRSAFKNIISIEAKLKKWRDGFYQAMRYKCFSHKSYLAVPEIYINNVDTRLLIENNIGLISVVNDAVKIVIEPRSEKPKDLVSFYHLSENMYFSNIV